MGLISITYRRGGRFDAVTTQVTVITEIPLVAKYHLINQTTGGSLVRAGILFLIQRILHRGSEILWASFWW